MKICFVIAHRYSQNNKSNIEYYIDNINRFYENVSIIIIDNNSENADNFLDKLSLKKNVTILINDIESKYELGAYQVGLRHLLTNNIEHDYYFFTQDNMIIKNRYDVTNLIENKIDACTIYTYIQDWYQYYNEGRRDVQIDKIVSTLNDLNLNDNIENCTFCFANSFIVSSNKIRILYEYLKKIKIEIKCHSCSSERFMARILYELNGHMNYDIDGQHAQRDCGFESIEDLQTSRYFAKYHGYKE